MAAISSACINLIHIADAASDAMLYFLDQDSILKGMLFCTGFFVMAWVFSFVLFRASFYIIGNLTPENEMDELIKNNTEIAWLHTIVIISLTFVIAPALSKIAIALIPYPKLPY